MMLPAMLLAATPAAAIDGTGLRAELRRDGPAAVLKAHFDPGYGDGYAAVEAGSADGIAVAVRLLTTVSDAGASERLQSALGTTLQRHPDRVLPLVGSRELLGADYICLPFIDAEAPAAAIREQARLTRAALARPESARFPRQRAACRRVLDRLGRAR